MNTSERGTANSDGTYGVSRDAESVTLTMAPGGMAMTLRYQASESVRILLIAGADGLVSEMQYLSAGSTGVTVDTGHLSAGLYSVLIHSSEERRIIGFVR